MVYAIVLPMKDLNDMLDMYNIYEKEKQLGKTESKFKTSDFYDVYKSGPKPSYYLPGGRYVYLL